MRSVNGIGFTLGSILMSYSVGNFPRPAKSDAYSVSTSDSAETSATVNFTKPKFELAFLDNECATSEDVYFLSSYASQIFKIASK